MGVQMYIEANGSRRPRSFEPQTHVATPLLLVVVVVVMVVIMAMVWLCCFDAACMVRLLMVVA